MLVAALKTRCMGWDAVAESHWISTSSIWCISCLATEALRTDEVAALELKGQDSRLAQIPVANNLAIGRVPLVCLAWCIADTEAFNRGTFVARGETFAIESAVGAPEYQVERFRLGVVLGSDSAGEEEQSCYTCNDGFHIGRC